MQNSVTNRQMAFMLFLILCTYGTTMIPKTMAQSAGTGAWVTIMLTSLLFALAAAMISSLNARFPGRMLFDYSRELAGKGTSYTITVASCFSFMLFIVFLVTQMANLLQWSFFIHTPKWVTMLLGIPVFCAIAHKGVTNAARIAEFIGVVFLIASVGVHLFMIMQGKATNILPLFDEAEAGRYLGAVKDTFILFVGCGVLYIIPFTGKNGGKKAVKTCFFTLLGIGLFYVLATESCFMKVGINDIVHYNNSLIVAIRETEIPFFDFMKRLDFLYLTLGFLGYFVGISLVYLAVIEFVSKLLKKVKRIWVTLMVGGISYVLCLWTDGIQGFTDFVLSIAFYLITGSAFVLPAFLLVVAKIKKIKKPS